MAASEPVTYRLGDVVFTVRERYSDAYLAMITTEAHLAEGVTGIITADAPFDPISAYGDNSAAVAARLGVDPGMTWAEAARQLNVPLYSVTAMLEVPEALCGSEAFADPLFNEDGNGNRSQCCTFHSSFLLYGARGLHQRVIAAVRHGLKGISQFQGIRFALHSAFSSFLSCPLPRWMRPRRVLSGMRSAAAASS